MLVDDAEQLVVVELFVDAAQLLVSVVELSVAAAEQLVAVELLVDAAEQFVELLVVPALLAGGLDVVDLFDAAVAVGLLDF